VERMSSCSTMPAFLATAVRRPGYAARKLQPFLGFRIGRMGGPSVVTEYGRPMRFGLRRWKLDECLLAPKTWSASWTTVRDRPAG
jgi:hypothetical protein